ncbi:MAG: hypothetical protein HYX26_08085 [Acidobacteriales bacterium]|nr:hypothetical protein [Terriglobales bacterium]
MQERKIDIRRISQTNLSLPQLLTIQSYVEMVDRLLDDQQFTPELKKPPQSVKR